MIVEKLVCGFQSGADLGAARAAKKHGIETFGWMPRHYKTEDGPRSHYAVLYGARETQSDDYPSRTKLNVYESDAALWFGDPDSKGGRLTLQHVRITGLPCLVVQRSGDRTMPPAGIAAWLVSLPRSKTVLFVGGNRESVSPGIGAWVEEQMSEVFALMAERVKS